MRSVRRVVGVFLFGVADLVDDLADAVYPAPLRYEGHPMYSSNGDLERAQDQVDDRTGG